MANKLNVVLVFIMPAITGRNRRRGKTLTRYRSGLGVPRVGRAAAYFLEAQLLFLITAAAIKIRLPRSRGVGIVMRFDEPQDPSSRCLDPRSYTFLCRRGVVRSLWRGVVEL